MKKNLTEGSVLGTMAGFSLPFLLSYFLQTLYGMADLYVIGQFCPVEATTAVAIGSQVMHMLTVMIVGLAMGAVVVIGQAAGAREKRKVSRAVGNTVTLFMALSLVLTGLLLLAVDPILRAMSTPPEAIPGTAAYLRICFLGIPFITAYNVISSMLRGMGDSRSPMYFIALACGANILLDYVFIGGLHMGPAGAALGTTLSQTLSVVLALVFLRRSRRVDMACGDLHPEKETMWAIVKIGLPVALQDGFIQIAFMVITVFANLRGLEDAAAVGIVEKLIGILFLVPSSLLQTVSAISAQNIGAGKPERARKTLYYACVAAVIWGLGVAALMHFFSGTIIGQFSDSPRAVELGVQYMRGYCWDCLFAGIHFSFSGYFCAWGLSGLSFLHNALSIVCVRVPLSYWAATGFPDTLLPMGLASPAGSALSVLICLGAWFWLCHRQKRGK